MPTVGASVCASGSQVCSGHSGLFTANAIASKRERGELGAVRQRGAAAAGQRDQVGGAGLRPRRQTPTSNSTEPNRV